MAHKLDNSKTFSTEKNTKKAISAARIAYSRSSSVLCRIYYGLVLGGAAVRGLYEVQLYEDYTRWTLDLYTGTSRRIIYIPAPTETELRHFIRYIYIQRQSFFSCSISSSLFSFSLFSCCSFLYTLLVLPALSLPTLLLLALPALATHELKKKGNFLFGTYRQQPALHKRISTFSTTTTS